MFKRTITYENYNGVSVKEDFYFNLNRSELTMMEMEEDGGLAEKLQKIVDKRDGKLIMKTFRDILLRSYGEKSDDGRRFMKSEEISRAFSETPAFDAIFVELVTDPEKALEFVNNLLPKELRSPNAERRAQMNVLDGGNDPILRGATGPEGALGD